MTPAEHLHRSLTEITTRWFPQHRATHLLLARHGKCSYSLLRWEKPGTGIFGVRYVLAGPTLFVDGDLGCAVYRWSEEIDLPFLAGCSLDYFAGKCQASETGIEYIEWEEEVAHHRLTELGDEHEAVKAGLTNSLYFPTGKESVERLAGEIMDATGDHELAGLVHTAGQIHNLRLVAHWLGLRLAHAQLTGKPN